MSYKIGSRTYGCVHCGNVFDVVPPDDRHTEATRNLLLGKNQVEMKYKCGSCGKVNLIYWTDKDTTLVGS